MIPKILLQVSKDPIPDYVIHMWEECIDSSWRYEIFDDDSIIDFFNNNPLPEFPNIVGVFNSFKRGAHKADLFRYYFMYLHGGVFVDSDWMLEKELSLNDLVEKDIDYFVTTSNVALEVNYIFNGFFGVKPKSEFVFDLLTDAYNTKPHHLERSYELLCVKMYPIFKKHNIDSRTVIYKERLPKDTIDECDYSYTVDSLGKVIGTHYFRHKVIPVL